MKKIINEFLRNQARKFFERYITVSYTRQYVSDEVITNVDVKRFSEHVKSRLVSQLAEDLYKKGLIVIEVRESPTGFGREFTASIRTI